MNVCTVPYQRELDSQAQEVVKRQDDSEVSRKKLVELSREFKRTSTEVAVCVCVCVCTNVGVIVIPLL